MKASTGAQAMIILLAALGLVASFQVGLAVPVILTAVLAGVSVALWTGTRGSLGVGRLMDGLVWASFVGYRVLLVRSRNVSELSTGAGIDRQVLAEIVIWIACFVYALARLAASPDRFRQLWRGNLRWMVLFGLLAAASSTYSLSPRISMAWSFKLLVSIILVAAILEPDDDGSSVRRLLRATLGGVGLSLAAFVVLGLFIPEMAFEVHPITGVPRLGGTLIPATTLSELCAVLAVLSLVSVLSGRAGWTGHALVVIGLAGMFSGLGRAGILAGTIGVLLVLLWFGRRSLLFLAPGFAVLLLALWPSLLNLSWDVISRRQSQEEIMTLTGRVPLWSSSLELVRESPLLGHGYVAGTRIGLLTAFRQWPATHAHNVVLQALLTVGLLGLALLLVPLANAWRSVFAPSVRRSAADPSLLLSARALLVILGVMGIFESSFAGMPQYDTCFLLVALAIADFTRRSGSENAGLPVSRASVAA